MRTPISVSIITLNEEKNIRRCLEAVHWADEIVVVDNGSKDNTVKICREFGCKVFINKEWEGFGLTKQKAVDYASNDLILSIDADEVVSDELKNRILALLDSKRKHSAYRIKRVSFYLGKMVKHCGWNRDYPIRLFDRRLASFNDKTVHESVVVQSGTLGTIKEKMFHYTYPTLEDHLHKMKLYSTLGSENLFKQGKRATIGSAMLRCLLKIFKMYILQFGFLDGKTGLILSIHSGWGVYLKYAKLWELNRESSSH